MAHDSQRWSLSVAIHLLLLALCIPYSHAFFKNEKSAVFLSPMFMLGPGSVENNFYYNVDFPKGHIAIKNFHAEVIDEAGNPVPLHETYLHHWAVARYYGPKDQDKSDQNNIVVKNSGMCQENVLRQYFGLGSETRKTETYIPDPYGIEIGNPAEIPEGYEEIWLLNVHAIDTRGVEDRLGCIECKCHLYNVTVDRFGQPLKPGYIGGLYCCYEHTQCMLRKGFQGVKRSLYLRYTVTWVDWDDSILPVKIYILDVTDKLKRTADDSTGLVTAEHSCSIEYEFEPCSSSDMAGNGCVDTKKTNFIMPLSGYVIYAVAHQHISGVGSTLYREDGEVICSSIPSYGKGDEPGNEAGYVVGMSSCYPQPGSIKITDGEILTLESNYSNVRAHLGVMGLYYILIADQLPKPELSFHALAQMQKSLKLSSSLSLWMVVAMVGVAITVAFAVGVHYRRRKEEENGYQSLVI